MSFLSRWRGSPEPDDGPTLVTVSVSQLKRHFIYDMGLSEHPRIIEGADLTLVSSEVDEMERRASTSRLSQVYPIRDLITRYADLAADIMTAVSFEGKDQDLIDADQFASTHEVFRTTSHAAIVCFLASFIDLGLLHGHYPLPDYDDDDDFDE